MTEPTDIDDDDLYAELAPACDRIGWYCVLGGGSALSPLCENACWQTAAGGKSE